MPRLDTQVRSDTICLLWFKARQAYDEFIAEHTEEQRETLNRIVRCLHIMLDIPTAEVAKRLKER